ncbi:hypothetical protein HA402_014267 [Bradysia odoriphaga]|nr:hypothetical protein HA402_014267 [Bradysia odoriphaga]
MDIDSIPEKRNDKSSSRCLDVNGLFEYVSKTNLFLLSCIAAAFSLISYLAAFSCEISWILEAHGDLPTTAYLLCSGYFTLFVASTILIHGLATGLSWGLFSWSVMIGCLAIPELCLVMILTTQFWGLQSNHGLTELIGYIVRLVINCLALLCVIPTGLQWRRERQVLNQLEGLASRLQLSTPAPSSPDTTVSNQFNRKKSGSRLSKRSRRGSGVDNGAYIVHENELPFGYSYGVHGSQNEFNASIFGLDPSSHIDPYGQSQAQPFNTKRTQSLLDLRTVLPPPKEYFYQHRLHDQVDGRQNHFNNLTPNSRQYSSSKLDKTSDPIYYSISMDEKCSKLGRNCVSLQNLDELTFKNDLSSYGNNLLQNYNAHRMYPPQQQQYLPPIHTGYHPVHNYFPYWYPFSGYAPVNVNQYNPYVNRMSKQSLGNESDDYRKYRDVAL